jgi:hypothetical protein
MKQLMFILCCLWGSVLQGQTAVIEVERPDEGLVTLSIGEGSEGDAFAWGADKGVPPTTWFELDRTRQLKFGGAKRGSYYFFLVAIKKDGEKLLTHVDSVRIDVEGGAPGPGPAPVVDLKAKTAGLPARILHGSPGTAAGRGQPAAFGG